MLDMMTSGSSVSFFFFNDTATTEIYTLSLHDALPIYSGKSLFFLTKKAGIGYLFTRGEGSKGLQTNVTTDLFLAFWQAFRFALTGERDVPLASRGTMDSTGFDLARDRPVVDHLDTPNLGKRHTVIMGKTETRLWEGEGVISVLPFKAGKARFLGVFSNTSEESFEGQINPNGDVLQDLGMDMLQAKAFLFQRRECLNLSVAGQSFTSLLIGRFTPVQQMIIQPTALFKGLIELVKLFLGWVDAMLKHFMHTWIFSTKWAGSQAKSRSIPVP